MQQLISGQNIVLNNLSFNIELNFDTLPNWQDSILEPSVFLLTQENKVRGDDDFIFYNQPKSKNGTIQLSNQANSAIISIDLNKIDTDIQTIAFTLVIDGNDIFANLSFMTLTIAHELTFDIPLDNRTEKSLIIGQCYRYNGNWKFRALGQGFFGGLLPLAVSYGVEIIAEESMDSVLSQSPKTVESELESITSENKLSQFPMDMFDDDMHNDMLDKIITEKAPHLSLFIPSVKQKIKKYKLNRLNAKVVFIFDASGSMIYQFSRGHVQAILDRIMVLSTQFDNFGSIEVWGFANKHKKYDDATLICSKNYIKNIQSSVPKNILGNIFEGILPELGINNNEPPVMMDVVKAFKNSNIPVIITFITDGGIYEDKDIQSILKESSNYPIFWKFIGLGGRNYGILEALNGLRDRKVNNTDFFPIKNLELISDDEFYEKLLINIQEWFDSIKKLGILN